MAATKTFAKRWLSDPAVWPIIGVMGVACGLIGYSGSRALFCSPDVRFNKAERSQILRTNWEEGEKFATHFKTMAELQETTTRRQMDEIYRGESANKK